MPASYLKWVPTSEVLGDDAEVEMKRKLPDALIFCDDEFVPSLLRNLNAMRQNGQYCDVALQVGMYEILGHRCVLAGMSQYLVKLFGEDVERRGGGSVSATAVGAGGAGGPGAASSDPRVSREPRVHREERRVCRLPDGLNYESIEALVQFAYTGRLHIDPSKVRSVYWAACRLKVEKVSSICAEWLVNNLDTRSCLEVRAMKGIAANTKLVKIVDRFISERFSELTSSKQLLKLPQVKVELLTPVLEELTGETLISKALLVLDWLRTNVLEVNNGSPLIECLEKLHLLYLNIDNRLHDCTDIRTDDSANTEVVQDYKKLSKKHSSRRIQSGTVPLVSTNQSDCSPMNRAGLQEGEPYWTVIACAKTDERGMVALVTVDGLLSVISLRQRLNAPSPTSTPVSSRPPSMEKPDHYSMLPELGCPKCATGVGNLGGKLIICGGYDRGECLRDVELYDPLTNSVRQLQPMNAARGRFDLTVLQGRAYAVGGCDGNYELTSVEMYSPEEDRWLPRAPLTMARSNTGVCALNGKIYCIGGWNGKFGSRKCEVYDPKEDQWKPIASLKVGRYQAAVTGHDGLVYAVGGCDSWNCLSSVEAYDPEADCWHTVPAMSTPRRGAGVSKLNNKLIVIGGSDGVKSLSTTEIYDPEEGEWVPGPKMTSCRANVNVAEISGKLFAVGGFSGKQFLNTMEYLDPRSSCWSTFISRRARGLSGGSTTSEEEAECPATAVSNNPVVPDLVPVQIPTAALPQDTRPAA